MFAEKLRQLIIKNDQVFHRGLEIFLGGFSLFGSVAFFIASFLFPFQLAYLVIFFDAFWLYKSFTLGVTAIIAYLRMKAWQETSWMEQIQSHPDRKKIHHIIIIPTVKEPVHTLVRTFDSIAKQTFPLEQLTVILALEKRVDKKIRDERIKAIKKKFNNKFGNLFFTFHELVPGEIIGKASNENYAARWVKEELVDKRGMDMDFMTVTSCDSDHCFHPRHYACVTHQFLNNPKRHLRFWQPAVNFYNNYWSLPALTRVVSTFSIIWQMAILARPDRMVSCQNYTLSLKLLHKTDYWNPDIVPEDFHLFFKAYFESKGKVEVAPIFLPVTADAAEADGFWATLKNTYEQAKRWSWGISDDPNVVKKYFLVKGVPFWGKTVRLIRLMEDHLFAPINWFFITLGITIPSMLVPEFSRTVLGYSLPRISSTILSLCLATLVIVLIINTRQRPARPKHVSRLRSLLIPFEFILMPISGFFFGALPNLDAHTKLMLGKRLEYKVTEKV